MPPFACTRAQRVGFISGRIRLVRVYVEHRRRKPHTHRAVRVFSDGSVVRGPWYDPEELIRQYEAMLRSRRIYVAVH